MRRTLLVAVALTALAAGAAHAADVSWFVKNVEAQHPTCVAPEVMFPQRAPEAPDDFDGWLGAHSVDYHVHAYSDPTTGLPSMIVFYLATDTLTGGRVFAWFPSKAQCEAAQHPASWFIAKAEAGE
jgi:hypothetical protein